MITAYCYFFIKNSNINERQSFYKEGIILKRWAEITKNLSLLTQFGLSLVIPLLICLLACHWLNTTFHLGEWVYLPGFILGLGSFGVTAYKLYLTQTRSKKREERETKNKVSFNRHV